MKARTRKICVVTGTRAEYGLLKPIMMRIIQASGLRLQLVVTGMHLVKKYGFTVKEIRNDGFKIDAEVPIMAKGDTKTAMTVSIGTGIIKLTKVFDILKPDIVLVLGDRFEILAAAIAASYGGRIVAHISGGDNPRGGYDEYTRHAITKISHIHFPSTIQSAKRIRRLGEEGKRIFTVGSTALDTIFNIRFKNKLAVCKEYGLDIKKPIILLIQHPLSTVPENAGKEIKITLNSIVELGYQTIVIYPNSDPGGQRMIQVINRFAKEFPCLVMAYKNLSFVNYLNLMNTADVMVGNSSSGIIESSAFNLPVVNIGTRQKGRQRAENVIDVPHNAAKIKKAIKKALFNINFLNKVKKCKNPYGDGQASNRIVKILKGIKLNKDILHKKLIY